MVLNHRCSLFFPWFYLRYFRLHAVNCSFLGVLVVFLSSFLNRGGCNTWNYSLVKTPLLGSCGSSCPGCFWSRAVCGLSSLEFLAAPPGWLWELLSLGFCHRLGASGKWVQALSPPCVCCRTLPEKGFCWPVQIYLVWCQGQEATRWGWKCLGVPRPAGVAQLCGTPWKAWKGTNNNNAEYDRGYFFPLSPPLLRTENTRVFLAASRSTFRTRSPCFLPQAQYRVLGTWLPKQGREDIRIFPTPFFSLVDISRCASSRLAKHKQAFRLTGSWTKGPAGARARVPCSPRQPRRAPALRTAPALHRPHRRSGRASKYPSPKGFCWLIFFFF